MLDWRADEVTGPPVPDADVPVATGRDHEAAVAAEVRMEDPIRVALEGGKEPARLRVPDAGTLVVKRRRDEKSPVRGKARGENVAIMSQSVLGLAACGVPHHGEWPQAPGHERLA